MKKKGAFDLIRASDINNIPSGMQIPQGLITQITKDGEEQRILTLSRGDISSARLRQASYSQSNNGTERCGKLGPISSMNHSGGKCAKLVGWLVGRRNEVRRIVNANNWPGV